MPPSRDHAPCARRPSGCEEFAKRARCGYRPSRDAILAGAHTRTGRAPRSSLPRSASANVPASPDSAPPGPPRLASTTASAPPPSRQPRIGSRSAPPFLKSMPRTSRAREGPPGSTRNSVRPRPTRPPALSRGRPLPRSRRRRRASRRGAPRRCPPPPRSSSRQGAPRARRKGRPAFPPTLRTGLPTQRASHDPV